MPSRDSQTVILSRQTILLVTAVGVGLLTLCYVLGVQVGKQSAALRHPLAKDSGEELTELQGSVADQLKALETAGAGFEKAQKASPAKPEPAAVAVPKGDPPAPAEAAKPEPPKPEPKPKATAPTSEPKAEGPLWTLQLVSTPDQSEAQRMAAKARGAGFPTATVVQKGLYKVRLTQSGPRESADAAAQKLKNRGFRPFAVKVE